MTKPPAKSPPSRPARSARSEKAGAAPADAHADPPAHATKGPSGGDPWIDLVNPTPTDEQEAHAACGHRIPSREDLSEVESSSRHYLENGAVYLSAPLLVRDGDGRPKLTPVGFILTPTRLVTIRFEKLPAFEAVREGAKTDRPKTPAEAFVRLIESIVDSEADVLEHVGEELEDLGHTIFVESRDTTGRAAGEMRSILRRLGHCGEKLGKLRHSLATLARIAAYAMDNSAAKMDSGLRDRLNAARDDVDSLAHFQEALTNKSQFLLDAALGFINIDQNDVIKVLTVASVVGILPTLIASNYGMNFEKMPELKWAFGYPYALLLMLVSTLAPLAWFKWKRWF